jgi:hypothetical protein
MKKMTLRQAVDRLRRGLGERDDHHPDCDLVQLGKDCDCYAQVRTRDHEALDLIEEVVDRIRPAPPIAKKD